MALLGDVFMIKKYNDGGIYEGEGTLFSKKRHGKGKMTYANGEVYEGAWVDDQRCGYGKLFLPRGYFEAYSYSGEWKNDLLNGQGKFTDGCITFEGSFLNGKYHGEGTLTKKLSNTPVYYSYKGGFKNGLKDGKGKEICQEYTYTGEFINDKFDGKGKKEFPNGDFFEGTFVSGVFKSGHGKITDKENTIYQGKLHESIPNGSGKYIYSDGKTVSGVFDNGKKQGKFMITLTDGTKYTEEYKNDELISSTKGRNPKMLAVQEKSRKSAFEAFSLKSHIITNLPSNNKKIASKSTEKIFYNSSQYELYRGQKNDKNELHGFGVLTLANSTYEGEFVNGKISGLGIYTVPRHFKYYGECSEITSNIRIFSSEGRGVRTFDNGNEYAGDFKLGGFSGFGVYSYANGDKYEGEFSDSKKHGKGVFTCANGDIYEGEFKLDKMEGEFSVICADGSTRKEMYIDGTPANDTTAKLTLDTSDNKKKKSVSNDINKSIEKAIKSKSKRTQDEDKGALKSSTKKEDSKKEGSKTTEETKSNVTTSKVEAKKVANENKFSIPPYVSPQEIENAVKKAKEASKNATARAQAAERNASAAVDTMNRSLNSYSYKCLQTISYKDPSTNITCSYKGYTVGDMLQGFGFLSWDNGVKFYGNFIANTLYGDGVLYFSNGDRYEGKFVSSMREGDSVLYYNDGTIYKGHFSNSNLHGGGVLVKPDGSIYEGDFDNNNQAGYGIFRHKQYTYEGQFLANEKHGYGVCYNSNGFRYEGQFVNGTPCGQGAAFFEDGSRFVGQFKNDFSCFSGTRYRINSCIEEGTFVKGNLNGRGKRIYKDGDYYEGDFKDGLYDGVGTYTWANGEKYSGDWKNNSHSGRGAYYFANGDIYTGLWKNGKRNGKGTLHYANGDVYTGQWKNSNLHGKGCYTWGKNTEWCGDKYEGDWDKGIRTGKGIYRYANGDIYEGDFVNDAYHGMGKLTYADGTVKNGAWENGDFVEVNNNGTSSQNQKNSNNSNNNNSNNNNMEVAEKKAMFSPENTVGGITFNDVAGLDEVKEQIKFHVLEPLKNPELAKSFGIKAGGKILLYGPPGTGKTLVARAIAGEIDAPIFVVSCQDLISKWLGESSERLNKLFDEVEKHEKAIVFFDEFDSVATKRDGANESKEIARFVATFLTRVDGFKPTQNKMLLLIAATNRPWSIDSAMLRGGRFDTQIYVGVPDKTAREFLVNKSLGKLPLSDDVDLAEIAQRFEGFGGGDITAVCDKIGLEAYKKSIKLGKMQPVSREDCEYALANAKNSITKEELDRFEEYKKGQGV